ncbi:MAG: MFS transporter [Dehalococcoidia bacterium]
MTRQAVDQPAPVIPDPAVGRRQGGRFAVFESFRIRGFRFQWSADALSSWGFEMETLILGWYILVNTGSAFLVGLFAATRFGGTLLAPFFGVLADRFDRRRMLILLRITFMLHASSLMVLALTGMLQPWHVFLIAAISGLVRTADNVLRQTLIADVVPADSLMNAYGLSRTTMDSARITGSLLGAGLMSQLGIGPAYMVVTAFYASSTAMALGITVRGTPNRRVGEGPWKNLRTGALYMRRSQIIMAVMFLAFLVNLTVFPIVNGLMPIVALEVYNLDENGLAQLVAATAIGALVGSLAMAAFVHVARPERMMIVGIVAWHVMLLIFTRVDSVAVALPVLGLFGAATSLSMVSMSVVLLSSTAREFRGRVMGVRMLAVYGLPIGLVLGGFLIEQWGVQTALSAYGVVGLVLTIAALVVWPVLLRSSPAPVSPPAPPAA